MWALVGRARSLVAADPVRAAIRATFLVMSVAAAGWDLPSSFSWENDGVAPRDIFAGVAENLRSGHAFRYPLLHPLALGILCLPVLVGAALRAPSFHLADLRAAVLTTPVMTTCTLIGRAVAILSALVALAALARIATRLGGTRAGRWAEAFAAVNISFAYYGRATNLDGPALMWGTLAIERLLLATERGAWRDHLWFAVFAAASIATKDQAYATYALVIPFLVVARMVAPGRFAAGAWSTRRTAAVGAIGGLVYAIASGALFNPAGFVTRVRNLTGSASGDYRAYARSWSGLAANLWDIAVGQSEFWWPWPVVVLAWSGAIVSCLASARPGRWSRASRTSQTTPPALTAVPLLAGLGSLVAFALVVGRAEHRFVLPLGFWLSIYAGLALEAVRLGWATRMRSAGLIVGVAGTLLVAWGLVASVELIVTQWRDGRHDAEAMLLRLPVGTRIETYGPLVYLPLFSPPGEGPYQVERVGPEPVTGRNPLPGMREVQDAIAGIARRRPDVIVVTEGFATPYLAPSVLPEGRTLPLLWQNERADSATAELVRAATADTLTGYRLCMLAAPELPFAPRRIHASTGGRTWVLVSTDQSIAYGSLCH